ncbi:MAG: hypothetical protein HZC36_06615 [Armatimonadetes bacterium]|nr:hypothetical protein [Armatimonadota bacterium]
MLITLVSAALVLYGANSAGLSEKQAVRVTPLTRFAALTDLSPMGRGGEVASVKLRRIFAKGEKFEYEFKSSLLTEVRDLVITTFMPEKIVYEYKFGYEITALKPDGFCELKYKRPSITITEPGEDGPEKTVEKLDQDVLITLSPVNDMVSIKDQSPPKKGGKDGGGSLRSHRLVGLPRAQVDVIGQFVGELHRLAAFVGSMDSSLDFSPRLPFEEEVAPGATWKRTVGYSPQKSSSDSKMVVQRLDYTYTYVGMVESGGKQVQRVTADMSLDSDLAQFIHDTFRLKPAQTGLKAIPLKLKVHVDYDLDPKTMRTIVANATSEGGFSVTISASADPVIEEIFHGTCKLKAAGPAK